MKKLIGALFIVFGIFCLPGCLAPSVAESVGRLIGTILISFLPAYLLLREKGKKDEDKEGKKEE